MSWGEVVKQTDSILDGVKDLLVNRYSVSNTPLYSLTTPLTYSYTDNNYKIISDVFYPPKSGMYKIKMSFDITLTSRTSNVSTTGIINYVIKSLYKLRQSNSRVYESDFNTLFGKVGSTITNLSLADLNLVTNSIQIQHEFKNYKDEYRETKEIVLLVYLEENSPLTILAQQQNSQYVDIVTKINSVEIY